jgi:hypothetical protein
MELPNSQKDARIVRAIDPQGRGRTSPRNGCHSGT